MNRLFVIILLIVFHFTSFGQNKELKKLYSKGKYDQVIDKAQILLKADSTNTDVISLLGRAHVSLKQYQEAVPYLKETINSEIVSVETKALSKAYLAKCLFVNDEKSKAVSLLKECQNGRESKDAVRYANKYLRLFQTDIYYKAWEVKETDNIRFHFQDKRKLNNSDLYMNMAQLTIERHIQLFNYSPIKKIDLFVWTDINEAFRKFNRQLGFSNSDLCTVNVLYNQKNEFELCHMLTQNVLKPRFKSMLIKEGLGMYIHEMDKNLFQIAKKNVPAEFRLLELWEHPTRYERDLSYPVGAAFIEFLINKGGTKKLKQFLRLQTIENAEKVYPDFDKWVKIFEAMLLK